MNKKGQATVELGLTALLLVPLLFAIFDLAIIFYVNLTMQHAVHEGARCAITGQSGDRRAALIQNIKDSSHGLYDKNAYPRKDPTVTVLTPSGVPDFSNYSGTQVPDTGKPDEIIVVSLTYSWPLLTPALKPFFPDESYTFTVRSTMKNEPWGP